MKGVIELIDIWKLVVGEIPTAKLAVVGIGALESELRQKINSYGLESNITLFGFLDGKRKEDLFERCKLFIHPSIYDSGGMAAAEAMAFGLPAIGFDLANDYYQRGIIKVAYCRLDIFASKIVNLLLDNELYESLSSAAFDYATEWSWDKKTSLMISAIQDLLVPHIKS